ncbi:MAG: 4Fe-4S binding protein, partial [Dehalococcoidia bacterium]
TIVFGFVYSVLVGQGTNPNPVFSLRTFLTAAVSDPGTVFGPVFIMLVVLLLMVWVSNKSICGWGCQLGLLQDLLYRVPLPKWKPSFWVSNTVRIVAFAGLVIGLVVLGFDWIGAADPFQLFLGEIAVAVAALSAVVLIASVFIYRPWCQFLCPFGLVGWLLEQISVQKPRINREVCKECQLCVTACPTQAMSDIYQGKKLHADCFACGACLDVCPQEEALNWRRK